MLTIAGLNNSIYSDYKAEKDENPAKELYDEYGVSLIAHRGSSNAPENTLSAFNMTYNEGYNIFECDVRWSKDDIAVILHDDKINRTARRKSFFPFLIFGKKCSNLNYDELLKYDFGSYFNKNFKGEKIPEFSEMLDCVKQNDGEVYIELKQDIDSEKAKILVDEVIEKGLVDDVSWISFDEDSLKEISQLLPEARLGYLYSKTPDKDTIETLDNLNTDENEVFLDVKASKMAKNAADLVNSSNYSFEVWTVDNIDDFEKMYSLGCRGFTTNELTNDEILKFLDELYSSD